MALGVRVVALGLRAGAICVSDSYAALRHRFVRSFAIGRFAAIAGWQMINVAVGWLLYERTGDPWALGLVGAVELAPVLLLINYVFIGFSNEFGAFESGATAALVGPTLSVVGGGLATRPP